jgi:hypothetical protein
MTFSNETPMVLRADPAVATIPEEIAIAQALCSKALESDSFNFIARLHCAPTNAEDWFKLLSGIPEDAKCVRRLQQLHANAERISGYLPGTLERFGILQTYVATFPRLPTLPVHPSIHLEFCATAKRIADCSQGWPSNFNYRSDAFEELCRIVTLRRFHAGQLSFDIMSMPRTWLLKVHPVVLPQVIRELVVRMGGIGPIAMPHLYYWRRNPLLMTQNENERALWRIAKSIELQPNVKGFIGASWFYCASIGEISPHLAWVRDFFQDQGAFLVDMEPAPVRSGFMIGSEKRRRSYGEGKFRPRQTLVLWPRNEMIRWAASYQPESMKEGSASVKKLSIEVSRRGLARRSVFVQATSSGRFTLLDCERVLTYAPRRYAFIVFVIPWLLLTALSSLGSGIGGMLLAAILSPIAIWLVQYVFLQ